MESPFAWARLIGSRWNPRLPDKTLENPHSTVKSNSLYYGHPLARRVRQAARDALSKLNPAPKITVYPFAKLIGISLPEKTWHDRTLLYMLLVEDIIFTGKDEPEKDYYELNIVL